MFNLRLHHDPQRVVLQVHKLWHDVGLRIGTSEPTDDGRVLADPPFFVVMPQANAQRSE